MHSCLAQVQRPDHWRHHRPHCPAPDLRATGIYPLLHGRVSERRQSVIFPMLNLFIYMTMASI